MIVYRFQYEHTTHTHTNHSFPLYFICPLEKQLFPREIDTNMKFYTFCILIKFHSCKMFLDSAIFLLHRRLGVRCLLLLLFFFSLSSVYFWVSFLSFAKETTVIACDLCEFCVCVLVSVFAFYFQRIISSSALLRISH